MTRVGDWMQVTSGIQFWPLDPRPDEILLTDIARALSNLCRYGGHIPKGFYSVAQHSVLVSMHVEQEAITAGMPKELVTELAGAGLMHDSPEGYIVDVPRPIKHRLGGYKDIEYGLAEAIGDKWSLPLTDLPGIVKRHDERALVTEKRDLLAACPVQWGTIQGHDVKPWDGGFEVGRQVGFRCNACGQDFDAPLFNTALGFYAAIESAKCSHCESTSIIDRFRDENASKTWPLWAPKEAERYFLDTAKRLGIHD